MRILVLGGTKFLGRWFVEAATARGHVLTLLNRGVTDGSAFPGIEQLRGDRRLGDEGLAALGDRSFDAVFDPSTHLPQDVETSVRLLAPRIGHYTYVSSISAYADQSVVGLTEDAPAASLTPEQESEVRALPAGQPLAPDRLGALYGPLKATCEKVATRLLTGAGRGALIVRPGLIVGPNDPTDRFTYWPVRFLSGGEVLAPGSPARQVQLIDVRDLAEWCVRLVETGTTDTIQATGPATPLSMGETLDACALVARERGAPASHINWVSEEFLTGQKVGPWMELPLWLPEGSPEHAGMLRVSLGKALGSGLRFRPLPDTIRATLDWNATLPADRKRAAGLAPEREAGLLGRYRTNRNFFDSLTPGALNRA